MATLIPAFNSCKPRMTAGERRLAERLEQKLEDDYLLWCDVPLGTSGFHPDFMVLHPRCGILILEVKDWKLENIQRLDKATATLVLPTGLKRVPNPFEQARVYAHAVVKLLEKAPALVSAEVNPHTGKLRFPWSWPTSRAQFEQTDPFFPFFMCLLRDCHKQKGQPKGLP